MRYRLMGRSGLRISELFLGAMRFGTPEGGSPPEECRRIVDLYDEAGGNVIDTANAYGDGRSETILGELLESRRERFVLATKYTISRDRSDPNAAGNHRKSLVHSLEASLRRLRTDYVDVYWVHMWDRHTPLMGARTAGQLKDGLGALDVTLADDTRAQPRGGDRLHRRFSG